MKCILFAGFVLVAAFGRPSVAQEESTAPASAPAPSEMREWSFSASALQYFVPHDRDYVQTTLTADHDWLHLEARYNYEDIDTGSAWIGYNFDVGKELALEFTPMVGAAIGRTDGLAIGYRGTLDWWRLSLFSESEFLLDTDNASDSFFYNWTQATIAPTDWLYGGVVIQRTRAYETERDVQRGFLVGLNLDRVGITFHVFNPDLSDPTYVVALELKF